MITPIGIYNLFSINKNTVWLTFLLLGWSYGSYSQNINYGLDFNNSDSILKKEILGGLDYNNKMNSYDNDIISGSSLLAISGACLAINLIGEVSGIEDNGLFISMNISSVAFLITGGSLIAIGTKKKKSIREKYYSSLLDPYIK
jgi:hypothetical protein